MTCMLATGAASCTCSPDSGCVWLQVGDVVAGKISQLADFGAFVDLNFPDGELHGVEVRSTQSAGSIVMHTSTFRHDADSRPTRAWAAETLITGAQRGCRDAMHAPR